MREVRIFYTPKQDNDKRNQLISPERIAELYPKKEPELENRRFWGFVQTMREKGKMKFCVARKDEKYANDPDLMFFEIGEVTTGEYPDITFLGKQMTKGAIEVTNRFAAETYGYWVLQLDQRNNKK